MMLNVLAAHALPISLACNALLAPVLVWALISLRSWRGKSTCCEQALAERTVQLRNEEKRHSRTQEALRTATDFIATLYPVHRQEAGDAADYGELSWGIYASNSPPTCSAVAKNGVSAPNSPYCRQ